MDQAIGAMTPQRPRPAAGRRSRRDRSGRRLARWRFAAMGTQVELLVVDAPDDCLAVARARLDDLERRWSRFLPGSETSALNRAGGRPVAVSPETFTLVALAVLGWRASGGRFDPTVLDALERAGYDRSFERLPCGAAAPPAARPRPAPGLDGAVLDDRAGKITLPAGTRFDPGGIAKGYAADLLCSELLAAGAAGVCANVGGDLLVSGASPHGGPWVVAVPHPHGGSAATLELDGGGAVATSSPVRRAWSAGAQPMHHLIDPRTGQPAHTGILQLTVVAGEAWWAEVVAKAAYLAGSPGALEAAAGLGAEALVVGQDGRVQVTAGLKRAARAAPGTR
jgi:thiamine biosynthesis lipoprotein